jgi:amidase/6-aminohexanoate-cyclic-dimer hydrolase
LWPTTAARWRSAFLDTGVSIFGKSSSPEFGLMPTTESRLHGPTRNPWNLEHSSGGSSGGAAAAVAARILPVAHASDGGGSIRIPASASGVFGLKPTRARNPLGPDRGEGWGGFACGHVVSISVRDSAVMMDAIHGPEPSSPYVAPPPERPFSQEVGRDPGKLRIAFTDKSPYGDAIDPEIAAAVREVAGLLAGLGHHVEERAPVLAADPAAAMTIIVGGNTCADGAADRAEARACRNGKRFRDIDAGVRSQRAKDHRDRLCRRPARGLPDFALARDLLRELRRLPVSDIVLAAAAHRRTQRHVGGSVAYSPNPAPLYAGDFHVQYVRQPAMSVPLAWNGAGLPLGMMFSARFGDEATLFGWPASSNRYGPGVTNYRRCALSRPQKSHGLTKPGFLRKQGKGLSGNGY